jgi:hypothetical protein
MELVGRDGELAVAGRAIEMARRGEGRVLGIVGCSDAGGRSCCCSTTCSGPGSEPLTLGRLAHDASLAMLRDVPDDALRDRLARSRRPPLPAISGSG